MAEYMLWCARRGLRPRYVDEIYRTLTRLQREFGPLTHLAAADLEPWWTDLAAGIAPGTQATYLAHLSGFYRWTILTERRLDNPTDRLVRPRQHRGLPRPIADERLRLALRLATPPLDAWLHLACFMGLRAHEVATLRGEDLMGDRLFVRDGKGGHQRVVPIHPEVARRLPRAGRGPLWTNARGRVLTANALSHRANRYLHELGIPESFHQLRHWFGTNIYRQSQDLRLTQELCGHQSPITTAGYAAWANDAAAGVVGRLDLLGTTSPAERSA